jgi:hypothetical protein
MKTDKNNFLQRFNLGHSFLIVCFDLFLVFLIDTFQMEYASSYLLPRMLCIFGLVVIILMFATGSIKRSRATDDKQEERSGVQPGIAVIFTAVYFFGALFLGFILATTIAFIVFAFMMKYQKKLVVYILSIIIPFVLHIAFVNLLKAPLPSGVIEKLLF